MPDRVVVSMSTGGDRCLSGEACKEEISVKCIAGDNCWWDHGCACGKEALNKVRKDASLRSNRREAKSAMVLALPGMNCTTGTYRCLRWCNASAWSK